MRYIIYCFTLICCSYLVYADEIKFTNGKCIGNVLVIDTVDNIINVITPKETLQFKLNAVEKINKTLYDPFATMIISNTLSNESLIDTVRRDSLINIFKMKQLGYEINTKKEFSNLKYLPFSFLAFGLSWDFFEDVSLMNKKIMPYYKNRELPKDERIQFDEYKAIRARKYILGSAFFIAGIFDLFYSIIPVDVQIEPDEIKVSYNF